MKQKKHKLAILTVKMGSNLEKMKIFRIDRNEICGSKDIREISRKIEIDGKEHKMSEFGVKMSKNWKIGENF